jgi:hypothetical protein
MPNLSEMTPGQAGDEALRAMPAMLREIREVMYLSDCPRRAAALAEKRRVLALVERSKQDA